MSINNTFVGCMLLLAQCFFYSSSLQNLCRGYLRPRQFGGYAQSVRQREFSKLVNGSSMNSEPAQLRIDTLLKKSKRLVGRQPVPRSSYHIYYIQYPRRRNVNIQYLEIQYVPTNHAQAISPSTLPTLMRRK